MIKWHLGTIGFSYKDWNAVFYPDGMVPRDRLAYYSRIFSSVELDSTFYGTPRPEYVERWAAVTPLGFTICPKTPREITHDLRLIDAKKPMNTFVRTMRLLGDTLGAILIQLPPDYTFSHFHKLAVFLRNLPDDLRYAVEFRHTSWHTTATGQLLQNLRIAWVSTDYIHMPRRIYVTTDFIYIRWIGHHGKYDLKDHERVDLTPRLNKWWTDIQSRIEDNFDIYGYFNNDFSGHSPATCNRFKEIVGLPAKQLKPPQQRALF